MEYTLDATNQSLGRIASKIAVMLRGKLNPKFQPNVEPNDTVTVSNVAKMKLTGKKAEQKTYYHYSGFPGGMKARKLDVLMDKNPKRVLWLAVYRMLARNRMRDKIIKNLTIS